MVISWLTQGSSFANQCLCPCRCLECKRPFAGKNLFVEKDGGAMCKSCYGALHGAKCVICGTNESKAQMHRNFWTQVNDDDDDDD